jgi:hypothetical protein
MLQQHFSSIYPISESRATIVDQSPALDDPRNRLASPAKVQHFLGLHVEHFA